MNSLIQFDKELLLYLNSLNTPLFDRFFWIYTSILIWVPLYLVIAYLFIKPNYKTGLIVIGGLVLTFVLTDQISSALFKNLFERWRPTHEPTLEGLVRILNNYKGGPYGFVSGHAANSFALATFVSYFFKNRWVAATLFCWAAINGYSRIYLGVHYPGDVLCGALLGVTIAWGVISLLNFGEMKYKLFSRYGANPLLHGDVFGESYRTILLVVGIMVMTIFFASISMVKFL